MGKIDENTNLPLKIVAILLGLGTGGAVWATKTTIDMSSLKESVSRIEARLGISPVASVPKTSPNQAAD